MKIFDPIEYKWPENIPPVDFVDAESGEVVIFDGRSDALTAELTAFQQEREVVCRDARVDMINVANGGDVLKPVIEFFTRRRKRAKRM